MVLPFLSGVRGLQSGGGLIRLTATSEITLTSREEALFHMLLSATRRLSTQYVVEELCAFRVWPLVQGWSVRLGALEFGLPAITVANREG